MAFLDDIRDCMVLAGEGNTLDDDTALRNSFGFGAAQVRIGSARGVKKMLEGHNQYMVTNHATNVTWLMVYCAAGHASTNTRVVARRSCFQCLGEDNIWRWAWREAGLSGKRIWHDQDSNPITPNTQVFLPGNVTGVKPNDGFGYELWPHSLGSIPNVVDFYGTKNIPLFTTARGWIGACQVKLELIDPNGVDDRHLSKFIVQLGFDPYSDPPKPRYINDAGQTFSEPHQFNLGYPYGAGDGDYSRWMILKHTDDWRWVGCTGVDGWWGHEADLPPPWGNYDGRKIPWNKSPYVPTPAEMYANPPLDPDSGLPSTPTQKKLIFFGDSLIAGNEPTFYSPRGRILNDLSATGYNIDSIGPNSSDSFGSADDDHAGYGGATIGPDSTGNNLHARIGTVLGSPADVVVILAGTNNITGNGNGGSGIATEFTDFVEDCIDVQPNAKFVLLVPHAASWYTLQQLEYREDLLIAAVALETEYQGKVCYFDLNTVINPTTHLSDGLHWTQAGAIAAANGAKPYIQAALDGNLITTGPPPEPPDVSLRPIFPSYLANVGALLTGAQSGDSLGIGPYPTIGSGNPATYSIVYQSTEGAFAVNSSTGQITAVALPSSLSAVQTVVIRSTDTVTSDTLDVTYTIHVVDENPFQFYVSNIAPAEATSQVQVKELSAQAFLTLLVGAATDGEVSLQASAALALTAAAGAGVTQQLAGTATLSATTFANLSFTLSPPMLDFQWPSPSPREITGTGEVGALIDLLIDGTLLTAVDEVAGDGTWAYVYTGSVGIHSIKARQTLGPEVSPFTELHTFTIAAPPSGSLAPPATPPVSNTILDRVRRTSSPNWPLVLLELRHPQLSAPVRIVNDTDDITSNGDVYTAYAFDFVPPDDQDQIATKSTIELDNVGRDLVEWIEVSQGGRGATVHLAQVIRSAPDNREYEIVLDLQSVDVTSTKVVLTLGIARIYDRALCTLQYRPETHPGIY